MARDVQSYSSLELRNASLIYSANNVDFPSAPKDGTTLIKEGVLYCYTTIRGVQTWYPLNNKYSSFVHTQSLPSQTWTVQHNFESTDIIYFIYDENSQLMFAPVTFVNNNTFTVNFTEDSIGRVVVFAQTDMFTNTITSTEANIGGVIIKDGGVQANNLLSATKVTSEAGIPANLPSGSLIFYVTSSDRLRFFNTTADNQTTFNSMDELTPFASGVLVWYYKATGGETQLSLPVGYDYQPGENEIEVEVEGNPLFLMNEEFTEIDTQTIGFVAPLVQNEIVTVKIRHS